MRYLKFINIFFPLILSLFGCVTEKTLTNKNSLDQYIAGDSVLGNGATGLEVMDPSDNRILLHYNANHFFTPASNTKLLTYYTGIKILGDSISSIRYCYRNDSLYFSGMGDPVFLRFDFSSQPVFDFLKNSEDTLVYIPFPADEQRFGPGWAWDDYPFDYSAERSSFPVFGDLVHIKSTPYDSSLSVYPHLFKDSIKTSFDTLRLSADERVKRNEFSNQFNVDLNISDSLTTDVPFIYSTNVALRILSDTLKK